MKMKNFMRPGGKTARAPDQADIFDEFDATELYCPGCRRAVPVRKHLLLILPDGEKYEYRCMFCAESVGTKKTSEVSETSEV